MNGIILLQRLFFEQSKHIEADNNNLGVRMNYESLYNLSGGIWVHQRDLKWMDFIWSLLVKHSKFKDFTHEEKALLAILLGYIYTEFTSAYVDEKGPGQLEGYLPYARQILHEELRMPLVAAEELAKNKMTDLHQFIVGEIVGYYMANSGRDNWEHVLAEDLIVSVRRDGRFNFQIEEVEIAFLHDPEEFEISRLAELFGWLADGLPLRY